MQLGPFKINDSGNYFIMAKFSCLSIILFCILNHPFVVLGEQLQIHADSIFQEIEFEYASNEAHKKHEDNIDLLKAFVSTEDFKSLDCKQIATLYHKLGRSYYILRDWSKALLIFDTKAIPEWENCEGNHDVLKANSYHAAAMSGQFLNEFENAILYLNKSLNLYETDTSYSTLKLGHKFRGAGVLHQKAGEYKLAELFYTKAIEYFEQNPDTEWQIDDAYNDLGLLHADNNNFDESVTFFKKIQHPDFYLQFYKAHNLTDVYMEGLDSLATADKYADETILYAEKLDNSLAQLMSFNLKGRLEFLKSDYKLAETFLKKGLSLQDSLLQNFSNMRHVASLHANLAETYWAMDDDHEASIEMNKAIALMLPNQSANSSGFVIKDAIIRNNADLISMLDIKIENDLQNKAESIEDMKAHLSLYYKIDSLFNLSLEDISLSRSQTRASSTISEIYEKAIRQYLKLFEKTENLDYFNDAFYFSSQLKSLVLRNTLRKYKKLNAEDNVVLRDMKSNLSNLFVEYAKLSASTDSIANEIIHLQRSIVDFEREMQRKYKNVISSHDEEAGFDIYKIQSELQQEDLFIEFFHGDKQLYIFVISEDKISYEVLDLSDQIILKLETFIRLCRNNLNENYLKLGKDLFSILLKDQFDIHEKNKNKLILVPDGLIHSFPIEALVNTNDNFLIEDYEIVHSYSHKLYFSERTNLNLNTYIGFGPTYSSALNSKLLKEGLIDSSILLPNLNLSSEEIKVSSDLCQNSNTYLSENATKTKFKAVAENAGVLHLSLHGLVDHLTPDNSSLLFYDGEPNFILKASEITELNLNSDLVILSSCQSGSGLTIKGEGVQGLSRAFILSGSTSVLSSLWNASEYSSLQILPKFIEDFVAGQSKAQSLQHAKQMYLSSVRPSLRHPFYWSNFILISQTEVSQSNSLNWILILFLLCLAFVLYFVWKKNTSHI